MTYLTHVNEGNIDDYLTQERISHGMLKRDFVNLDAIKSQSYVVREIRIKEQIDKYFKENVFDKYEDFKENNKEVFLVEFSHYSQFHKKRDKNITYHEFIFESDSEAKEAIQQYIIDNKEYYKIRYCFEWVIKKPYNDSSSLPWNQRRFYSMIRPGYNWYKSDDSRTLVTHDKEQFDNYWNNNKYYVDFYIINPNHQTISQQKLFELKDPYDWENLKNKIAILINSTKESLGFETINNFGDIMIFSNSPQSNEPFYFKKRVYKGVAIIIGSNKSNLILSPYTEVIKSDDHRLTDIRYESGIEDLKSRIVSFDFP